MDSTCPPALYPALCSRGLTCLDQRHGLLCPLVGFDHWGPGKRSESEKTWVLACHSVSFPPKLPTNIVWSPWSGSKVPSKTPFRLQ